MEKIRNDIFLKAALGKEVDRPPVWLMRQAGRILPEYRAIRSKLSGFKELVTNPQLSAEVTLQPVDILGVDAAIIFSDILVIPEALGLPYEMHEGRGPHFENPVQTEKDINKLSASDIPAKLQYVTDAIKLVKNDLNGRVPLIGFAGAPWTIFAYMVEGSGSKTFSIARRMLYTNPDFSIKLLDLITDATIQYLKAQIAAGANLIQIFDSWAGVLPANVYKEFSLKYINKICDAIDEVPVTVFAKGAFFALPEMKHTNCRVVGLDWNMNPVEVKKLLPNKTLQGNFDPCLLYAPVKMIEKETKIMLDNFGKQNYIANLGHGVYPDTPLDGVKAFIATVQNC